MGTTDLEPTEGREPAEPVPTLGASRGPRG